MNRLILGCLLHYFISIAVGKEDLFCASRNNMKDALDAVEDAAAKIMTRHDAKVLVEKVLGLERERGDEICFTREDFRILGHEVAQAGKKSSAPPGSAVVRLANFARPSKNPWENNFSGGQCTGCACRCKCGGGAEAYCGGWVPGCCPKFCSNIFRSISIGALTHINGDGLSTCCKDAMWKCIPQPHMFNNNNNNHNAALAAASKSPEPKEFQFKAPPSESPQHWRNSNNVQGSGWKPPSSKSPNAWKNNNNNNQNGTGYNNNNGNDDGGWQKRSGLQDVDITNVPLSTENSKESLVNNNNVKQGQDPSTSPTPSVSSQPHYDPSPSPSPNYLESIPIPSNSPIPSRSPVPSKSPMHSNSPIPRSERTTVLLGLNRRQRRKINNRPGSKMK